MQEVTIVIPNYNGKRLLENCLKTLEQQTYKDFKVLVVDNGSSDGSTEVSSEKLELEIVSLKENLGFCGAVNLGIQKTKTPYLILLNNDTEADRHFVEKLLAGIKKSERIFSCGAQMIDFKNHEMLDNGNKGRREEMLQMFRQYLQDHYPDWSEDALIYRKWE
jgi:GT2 family glycosyltransferase